MSTFANTSIQANGVWNTVTATWNTTPLYWSYSPPKRKGRAGNADVNPFEEDELLYELHDPYKRKSKEKFVKIFMTAPNQFLTEDQRKNVKIAGIYPTYGAKFKMKKENGLINENQKSKQVGIKAVNIKIGLEII